VKPNEPQNETVKRDWKFYLGLALLVFSAIPICTVELVMLLPLTKTQALSLGAVYLASGEGAFLLAVALLGKPFIQAVKSKIKAFLSRPKDAAPAGPIGKTRHYVGVSLFLLSFSPYVITEIAILFVNLDAAGLRILLILLLSGDVMCVVSLLVLGEEFWGRLQALFRWPGATRYTES
jgi:hypothetical protein